MPQRTSSPKEQIFVVDQGFKERSDLSLDDFERGTLTVARHLFQTYAAPESQCWMDAFMAAERAFQPPFGATIAHAISLLVNELRTARQRTFTFYEAGHAFADTAMTREERYLIQTIQLIRSGAYSGARTQAMLLCDGGDCSGVLAAIERLCIITGDVKEPRLQ